EWLEKQVLKPSLSETIASYSELNQWVKGPWRTSARFSEQNSKLNVRSAKDSERWRAQPGRKGLLARFSEHRRTK
ncbi:hypothetical protein A2U01_0010186, partial [Trifolium medium]|nr:hypothetical protein [Trifolium medium]